MADAGDDSILHYFRRGAEIEISSDDAGFRGSWYEGTVIRPPKTESSRVMVQYKTLTADEAGTRPLRESLMLVQLRPRPPRENRPAFQFSDEVDAYFNDGWWEGVITQTFEEDNYKVFFRGTREQLEFSASQLRLHREWVKGMWVPPLEPSPPPPRPHRMRTPSSAEAEASEVVTEHIFNPGDLVEANEEVTEHISKPGDFVEANEEVTEHISNPGDFVEANEEVTEHISNPGDFVEANEEVTEHIFNPGDLVEASSDEEGFEGAWFTATVLEKTMAGKYMIEYQKLRNDDDTGFLREEIDGLHLRPCPPDFGLVDSFVLDEEVDAWYNDCWWVGVISKIHKYGRYSVYFENSGEELKFEHSDLRVHQAWRNGKWHIASKVLK